MNRHLGRDLDQPTGYSGPGGSAWYATRAVVPCEIGALSAPGRQTRIMCIGPENKTRQGTGASDGGSECQHRAPNALGGFRSSKPAEPLSEKPSVRCA